MTSVAKEPARLDTPSYGPVFLWINLVAAWFAVGLSFTLNVTGYYVDKVDPSKPTTPNGASFLRSTSSTLRW